MADPRSTADDVTEFGCWPSPLSPAMVAGASSSVGEIFVDADDIWWSETRPAEGGRVELVRRRIDGSTSEILADRGTDSDGRVWSAQTGCYEYGGGAWTVAGGMLYFCHWSDQRIYSLVVDDPDAVPQPLTSKPVGERGLRYSDLVSWNHGWLIAVREAHPGESGVPAVAFEPMHEIVAIPVDGAAVAAPILLRTLVSGPDFVSSPRVAPGRLAWTQWDHPNMPWTDAATMTAEVVTESGGAPKLGVARLVAGGTGVSTVQPEWARDSSLLLSSDISGWRNLYRCWPDREPEPLAPMEAEIGGPRWVGGLSWYAPLGDGRILAAHNRGGAARLIVIEPGGAVVPVAVDVTGEPISLVSQVVAGPGDSQAVVVAASAASGPTAILLDLAPGGRDKSRGAVPTPASSPEAKTGIWRLKPNPDSGLGRGDIAVPESIEFPTAAGDVAYGQFYRPRLAGVIGPPGSLPPLVVMIHGGPTSAARPMLDLRTQFWTTRGFSVLDVDYRGSTGYGRRYQDLLDGRWGVADVEDCVAGARYLIDRGEIDQTRIFIRGGSAGGLTTLLALCMSELFAAGTSLYGVTDLSALARETHKFEARYLDGLVGPWPEAQSIYAERSPINLLDGLSAAVLVLQGCDDKVVPPSQAQAVVAAAKAKGIRCEYREFAGEGHGFRQASTIAAALEVELAFYLT